MNTVVLCDIKEPTKCVIKKLPEIGLSKSMGFREGTVVTSMTRQPFGGPVVVRLGKRNVALSRDIAKKIEVKYVS